MGDHEDEEQEYLKDRNGKIMLDWRGRPMPLDHFVNEPSDTKYLELFSRMRRERERIQELLDSGEEVDEHTLRMNDFEQNDDGEWEYRGPLS